MFLMFFFLSLISIILTQLQRPFGEFSRKQLEQVIQQLQEQLHLILFQQTQILQSPDKKKASGHFQQLVLQQQHLIQQIQFAHRQHCLLQGVGLQGQSPSSGWFVSSFHVYSIVVE